MVVSEGLIALVVQTFAALDPRRPAGRAGAGPPRTGSPSSSDPPPGRRPARFAPRPPARPQPLQPHARRPALARAAPCRSGSGPAGSAAPSGLAHAGSSPSACPRWRRRVGHDGPRGWAKPSGMSGWPSAAGRAAPASASRLAIPAGRDTLLRLVRRRAAAPAPATPRVLGADDFAFRRGRRYEHHPGRPGAADDPRPPARPRGRHARRVAAAPDRG